MTTKIEWCKSLDGTRGHTWNLFTGCTHKSDGCDHCYAARIAGGRLKNHRNYKGLTLDGKWTGEVRFNHHELDKPRHWKKPRMIFVNSMSDTFHDKVQTWWIDEMMGVIMDCPQHTFQILTKRSDNIIEKLDCNNGKLPHNVWLGVTVESDKYLSRIEDLLKVQAAVRFVSIEPCLGPINFRWERLWPDEKYRKRLERKGSIDHLESLRELDWVICGGESGHGARPMHPSWPRGLRDQCTEAGVPYFFKQWGDWAEFIVNGRDGFTDKHMWVDRAGKIHDCSDAPTDDCVCMKKVGKKRAGRLLDGREWNGMPEKVEGPRSKV